MTGFRNIRCQIWNSEKFKFHKVKLLKFKTFNFDIKYFLNWSLFVCLLKGGVVVLHTCLTIRNRICSIPRGPSHSLHIWRCIAVCQLSSIQWRIWTGLIFLVVLNPMPTWRHSVLDWGLLLCFLGCMAEFSHHLAGCHHTSPLITKPCLMRRVNQGVLCWLVCVWIQWERVLNLKSLLTLNDPGFLVF